MQRLDVERESRLWVRIAVAQLRRRDPRFALRLLEARIVLEQRDWAAEYPRSAIARDARQDGDRPPDLHVIGKVERRRRDTDDGVRRAIQTYRAANYMLVAAEIRSPESVAQ